MTRPFFIVKLSRRVGAAISKYIYPDREAAVGRAAEAWGADYARDILVIDLDQLPHLDENREQYAERQMLYWTEEVTRLRRQGQGKG